MKVIGKPVGIYDAKSLLLIKTCSTRREAKKFLGVGGKSTPINKFAEQGTPIVIKEGENAGLKIFVRNPYTAHPNFPEVDFPHRMVLDDKVKWNMAQVGKRVNVLNLNGEVLASYPSLKCVREDLKVSEQTVYDRVRNGRVVESPNYKKRPGVDKGPFGSIGPFGEPVTVSLVDEREKYIHRHIPRPGDKKPAIYGERPKFDKWKDRKWGVGSNSKKLTLTKVGLYDPDTLMLKQVCESFEEAGEILGKPRSSIIKAARLERLVNLNSKNGFPTAFVKYAYKANPNLPEVEFPDKMVRAKSHGLSRSINVLNTDGKILHTASSIGDVCKILKTSTSVCNRRLRDGKILLNKKYKKLETDRYAGSIGPFDEPVILGYADNK